MPDTAPGRRPCPGSGCARVLNIDIGGGTSNYALFDAGNVSATACLNVGGRLLETDAQGRVVHAHPPGSGLSMRCLAPALTPWR
ncbi:ethanolamine utilization protein EutA [Klebsiella pneumoniae]|uniref:Ethanolamine utilization protein EutA n=1 Tax=Klebsiella pneumoniae TaxID=573 RepID=A0A4P0YC41_KLEPN|nr:ethanolamine utilization protein EutA [Klebsiella pneumoniae]